MTYHVIESAGVPVWSWAPPDEIEAQAIEQLKNTASVPWVHHHVAAMPDVHLGKGATIGSVVATRGAIMPAAVGVDIGCGVIASKLSLEPEAIIGRLPEIRKAIEKMVPVGFGQHQSDRWSEDAPDLWQEWPDIAAPVDWASLTKQGDLTADAILSRARHQYGSLGGGNHFLEVCKVDADGALWVVLHSGSRGVGNLLSQWYTKQAYDLEHNRSLPDRDLSALLDGTVLHRAFMQAVNWGQRYAWESRQTMVDLAILALSHTLGLEEGDIRIMDEVHCHHNYVNREYHYGEDVYLTRKGAISAGLGEPAIIPGSMGVGSVLVRGLGSPESFQSASHGAGRVMSRGAAKRQFTTQDLIQQTLGVECRKDSGVVDEIPAAYKPLTGVMENQRDLVETVDWLRPLICVKG